MKTNFFLMAVALATGLIFSSCEKDDDSAKPVIKLTELGIGNEKEAYIGADLHIEAKIVAEGKIDKITVEIHQEEGTSKEIKAVYNDFSGMKNTIFHKHVDIPPTTVAGIYHFHITVTDKEGNSTMVEDEINIKELIDTEAPVLNITSQPENQTLFRTGDIISISGNVTDNTKLGGMLVALVYESDNITDADVTGVNKKVIVMLHTHTFTDPDKSNFSAKINVGATNDNNMTPAIIEGENAWKSGNYYILVKCKDVKGNKMFSEHYPVKIEL